MGEGGGEGKGVTVGGGGRWEVVGAAAGESHEVVDALDVARGGVAQRPYVEDALQGTLHDLVWVGIRVRVKASGER